VQADIDDLKAEASGGWSTSEQLAEKLQEATRLEFNLKHLQDFVVNFQLLMLLLLLLLPLLLPLLLLLLLLPLLLPLLLQSRRTCSCCRAPPRWRTCRVRCRPSCRST